MLPFFPDETAYRAWIAGGPAIFPCNEEVMPEKRDDPTQPWTSTTEGPYYSSPHFLLLRVGSGATARYCAVQRVSGEAEADFYWFVRASSSRREGGERMYAAYLWDTRTKPERVVAGETLASARARLTEHLSTRPQQNAITQLLA